MKIYGNSQKIFLVIALLFTTSYVSFSQNCQCNYTVEPSVTMLDGKKLNLAPGSTVCIKAGARKSLKLINFQGSPEHYLTFINCGGQVVVDNTSLSYGISVENCRYIQLSGAGTNGIKYGIKIARTKEGASGLGIGVKSSDFIINNLEIANVGFAGILSKTDPKCDGYASRGSFVQYNSVFYDNYIHDTHGEGFYIGHSFYTGYTRSCDGKATVLYPHELHGVRIYNNIVENTGWDGIQVGCATKDVEIYNNRVTRSGLGQVDGQMSGIQISSGTTGKCYNNIIIDGKGSGIFMTGLGNNAIYNNIIVNPGKDYDKRAFGIFCDDRQPISGSYIHLINNTIVNPKNEGISMRSRLTANNKFFNNIIIAPNATSTALQPAYISMVQPANTELSGNFLDNNYQRVKFTNMAANDFSLQPGSAAIDAGVDIAGFGIVSDYAGNTRQSGAACDAGACEHTANSGQKDSKKFAQTTLQPPGGNTQDTGANNAWLYPNPAQDFIMIEVPGSKHIYCEVKDLQGRSLMQARNSYRIDISALATGVYLMYIEVDGKQLIRKFQKN